MPSLCIIIVHHTLHTYTQIQCGIDIMVYQLSYAFMSFVFFQVHIDDDGEADLLHVKNDVH